MTLCVDRGNRLLSWCQRQFEQQGELDCTVACTQGRLGAHKFVLSAFSDFLSGLISACPCEHPTIVLDIDLSQLTEVLNYVYYGSVPHRNTASFLHLVHRLRLHQPEGSVVANECCMLEADDGLVAGQSHCSAGAVHLQSGGSDVVCSDAKLDENSVLHNDGSVVADEVPGLVQLSTENLAEHLIAPDSSDSLCPQTELDQHEASVEPHTAHLPSFDHAQESEQALISAHRAAETEISLDTVTVTDSISLDTVTATDSSMIIEDRVMGKYDASEFMVRSVTDVAICYGRDDNGGASVTNTVDGYHTTLATEEPQQDPIGIHAGQAADSVQFNDDIFDNATEDCDLSSTGIISASVSSPNTTEPCAEGSVHVQIACSGEELSDSMAGSASAADNPVWCVVCGRNFSNSQSLRIHMRTHTGSRPYRCSQSDCGATFRQLSHLNAHQLTHSSSRPFRCDLCQSRFKCAGSLQRHLLVHDRLGSGFSGRQIKTHPRFTCSVCGKAAATASALQDHVRVHTNQRPFTCSVCGKGFKQKSHLTEHARIHSGLRPFQCLRCPSTFYNRTRFRLHQVQHLNRLVASGNEVEDLTESERRMPICPICSKRFINAGHLKQHQVRHEQTTQLFQCDHCHASFNSRRSLNKHVTSCRSRPPHESDLTASSEQCVNALPTDEFVV